MLKRGVRRRAYSTIPLAPKRNTNIFRYRPIPNSSAVDQQRRYFYQEVKTTHEAWTREKSNTCNKPWWKRERTVCRKSEKYREVRRRFGRYDTKGKLATLISRGFGSYCYRAVTAQLMERLHNVLCLNPLSNNRAL
jgi:hypothetical protein